LEAPFNVIEDTGWHVLGLTSTGTTTDTGVGFYAIETQDSSAAGFYLYGPTVPVITAGTIISTNADTNLAKQGVGVPYRISGYATVSGSSATTYLNVQTTDTTKISVSLSASSSTAADSINATGSWSSTQTSGSGTARDSFFRPASFATLPIAFGDSAISGNFPLAQSIALLETGYSATIVDTRIAIRAGTGVDSMTPGKDTARLIVFKPNGSLLTDTILHLVHQVGDSTFATEGNIRFDSGTTDLWVVYWSDSVSKLAIRYAGVTVGNAATGLTTTPQTFTATTMGSVKGAALTVTTSTPQVNRVQITDVGGDAAAKSDDFARFDTNTTGFDTRLASTVFEINVWNGTTKVTKLASGQDYHVEIGYDFSGHSSSLANSIKLLRLNPQTEQWEIAKDGNGSTAYNYSDSANQRVVARVSQFSTFALGNVTTTTSSAVAKDDNCVINATLGRTGFASIMPAFRNVRDSIMGSALGRFLVSSYYGLGLAFLAFAGAGLAYARRK
jgi:hypothetical protein